jgi:superfamily II RNA helicase
MKSNAERQKAYRERKKAEKAALKDMQAPIDPAPESAMQSPSVMELMEGQERYREELQQQPVIDDQELTAFDVQKRRMDRERLR